LTETPKNWEAPKPESPRPARPQYGEYATPEQQAAALGTSRSRVELPAPEASTARQLPPPQLSTPGTEILPTRHPVDAFVTSLFLGIGVVVTINSLGSNLDLFTAINNAALQLGYGKYTSTGLAQTIGVLLSAVQVVSLLITVFLSLRAVRRGRRAFYIPLLGAAVFVVIAIILLMVALLGDPAFVAHIQQP
jgi:hypothetical protein